jgi:hypothetical protein
MKNPFPQGRDQGNEPDENKKQDRQRPYHLHCLEKNPNKSNGTKDDQNLRFEIGYFHVPPIRCPQVIKRQ